MKTKSILFIIAAVILLSFTVASNKSFEPAKSEVNEPVKSETQTKGFAMEDRNQW